MPICWFQAKYTSELQAYLQATGLKASDLVKPRSRKGRVQGKPSTPAIVQVCQAGLDDAARAALPHFSQVWAGAPQQVSAASHSVSQVTYSTANALPLNTGYRYTNTTLMFGTVIIIIIIIKFFNKKVVKRNFTNGEENGVQIIVSNNVYTKLLSRNVVRSDR